MSDELSPWPFTIQVSESELITVIGVSGNSYVIQGGYGLESPTTANEENVEVELPSLYAAFKLAQEVPCPPDTIDVEQ